MARRVFPEDSPALNSENIKESFDKIERWLRYMQERIEHMNYSQGIIDLRQSEELGLVVKRAGNTITINDDNIVSQSEFGPVSSTVTQNANSISSIVQNVGDNGSVTAASIVQAVNSAGSSVVIDADHIELDGNVVLKSNLVDGTTQISGSNIVTGTITDAQGHFSLNMTTGSLTMNDGNIGGWVIDSNDIHKDATISGATYRAAVRAPSSPTASQAAWYVRKGASSPYTYPFVVYYDGKLKATDADIEGTITSSNATITGGTVNIDTSVSTDDLIKLNYIVQNGASTYVHTHTEQSPTHFVVEQTPLDDSEHKTTVDSNGISNDYAEYYSLLTCANLVFKYAEPGGGSLTHVTRSVTSKDGVFFYDSSGTQTASYPASGLAVSGLRDCSGTDLSTSGTRTYTLPEGSYLVTLTRTSGTSANYDGAWLVTAATNSRATALKSPSNSGTSISMGSNRVMTVTTSQSNMRLTVTKLN